MIGFEVYKDKAGEWRWRLRAKNGEIVAQSEGYTRKAEAEHGVEVFARAVEKGAKFKPEEGHEAPEPHS